MTVDPHAYRKPIAEDCVLGSCTLNNCRFPDCSVSALRLSGVIDDDFGLSNIKLNQMLKGKLQ